MKLRTLLLAAALAASVFLLAAPAGAVAGVGKVTVTNPSPGRSSTIGVSSSGWRPGGAVSISLWGAEGVLARATADANGDVHTQVEIPADARPGFRVLSVNGATATGVPQEIVTALSVVGPTPTRAPDRHLSTMLLLAAIATVLMLVSQRVVSSDPQLAG